MNVKLNIDINFGCQSTNDPCFNPGHYVLLFTNNLNFFKVKYTYQKMIVAIIIK